LIRKRAKRAVGADNELLSGLDDDRTGRSIGVGGENGCSFGGAVISSACRRLAHAICVTVLVFVLAIGFAACSRPSAAPPPDATTLLQGIPAADEGKYPSLQASKHWSNPYLVIRSDRVGLLTGVAANEEQMLKPEEVLNALAALPASAWPYGRAVAILVEEKPTTVETEKIELRRNRGIVEGDLRSAHVEIRWIPTS
jgi:hypothetical protein